MAALLGETTLSLQVEYAEDNLCAVLARYRDVLTQLPEGQNKEDIRRINVIINEALNESAAVRHRLQDSGT